MKKRLRNFMGIMKNDLEGTTVRLIDSDLGFGIDTPYEGGLRPHVYMKYQNYFVTESELFYENGERYCDIYVSQEVNYGH